MKSSTLIQNVLLLSLLLALFLSAYIFFSVMIFKDTSYKKFFSTWQFPMLFALVADILFVKFSV